MKIAPSPCHLPAQPAGVSVASLRVQGADVVLSADEWRGVLHRDAGWQAAWAQAQACATH